MVWNIFFPYIGNVIIPTDEVHHFSEGFKPPTTFNPEKSMAVGSQIPEVLGDVLKDSPRQLQDGDDFLELRDLFLVMLIIHTYICIYIYTYVYIYGALNLPEVKLEGNNG